MTKNSHNLRKCVRQFLIYDRQGRMAGCLPLFRMSIIFAINELSISGHLMHNSAHQLTKANPQLMFALKPKRATMLHTK